MSDEPPTVEQELHQLEACILNLHLLLTQAVESLKKAAMNEAVTALVAAVGTTRTVAKIFMNKLGIKQCGKCQSVKMALAPGAVPNVFHFQCIECGWMTEGYNPNEPKSVIKLVTE